jgi:hypothetical protein
MNLRKSNTPLSLVSSIGIRKNETADLLKGKILAPSPFYNTNNINKSANSCINHFQE